MIESFKSFIPERSKIFKWRYLQIIHQKIMENWQKKKKWGLLD